MARLTSSDVLKLAQLSRLHLTDEEVNALTADISTILGYVEQLQEVDVAGVTPTNQVTGLKNVTRSDEVMDYGTTPESLLANAPSTRDGYFKVKRMIG